MSDHSSRRKILRDEPVFETPVGAFAAVRSGDVTMGEVLREHREAAGATLDEVADALRIRKIFLEALEENRIGDLPGQAYAIGFVRSYAEALGFDGEQAVEAYKHELAGEGNRANLVFPEPMPESRIPKGGILFVSVILAAAAYGVWYYMNEHNLRLADLVPEVPAELAGQDTASDASPQPARPAPASATTPAPAVAPPAEPATAEKMPEVIAADARPAAPEPAAEPPASPRAPAAAEATVETTAAVPPSTIEPPRPVPPRVAEMREHSEAAAAEASPEPTPEPEAASEPPGVPPAVPAAEPAPGASPAAAEGTPDPALAGEDPRGGDTQVADVMERIEVRAKADSWIQVRSEGGALLMTRILRAGDTYVVPRERGLSLMTGNAGALEIFVDGKAVPSIGPFGAVRRGVALDAGRLRAGTASRP